ncbi:MAG TPA: hypothetical protein VM841_10440 [Actinomycetota bacterium]|nr:hypothetical protein [Actinomycetota bacterium]
MCDLSRAVSLTGEHQDAIKYDHADPGTVFDARNAIITAYPHRAVYPFSVGGAAAPERICVVGGIVAGDAPRGLTWAEMKDLFDGDGLRIAGNGWYGVNGLRVDNVSDGIAPRGTKDLYPADGDGFEFRNLYFTYIRDDCVENDEIAAGAIYDSLFDGCYTGISERPSSDSPQWRYPPPPGETLLLDGVLLRLEAMPGPRGAGGTATGGHGQLFKWSEVANRLTIKRSIFLVEQEPNSTSFFPFPPGTTTEDVTIVWLGDSTFTWKVPSGTIVTTDRAVWDEARADWLRRHGCSSFLECSRLYDPAPPG